MIILGIDPGIAIVGWGVIDYGGIGTKSKVLNYGAITTSSSMKTEDRIFEVHRELTAIIKTYNPEAAAIEELFFNTNITTGIKVAQARGVILLAAIQAGIPIFEYTPLQVKQSIVGYGRAEKHQVIAMVTSLLKLKKPPKPDDTADAAAIAICHSQCRGSAMGKYFNQRG